MTRRRTAVDMIAASHLILTACRLVEHDDLGEVLALQMVALAISINEANPDPAKARHAAATAGPALAELVERVQAMKLEGLVPEGSA